MHLILKVNLRIWVTSLIIFLLFWLHLFKKIILIQNRVGLNTSSTACYSPPTHSSRGQPVMKSSRGSSREQTGRRGVIQFMKYSTTQRAPRLSYSSKQCHNYLRSLINITLHISSPPGTKVDVTASCCSKSGTNKQQQQYTQVIGYVLCKRS